MDVFSTLNSKTKIVIALSTSVLLILAIGLLLFGSNIMGHESELIHQAAEATRADMLYSHPEAH